MKGVKLSNQFRRHYKKRISKNEQLSRQFLEALTHFLEDRQAPVFLNDHQLKSRMKLFRVFAINSDYRVVYIEKSDCYIFLDIGIHQQVYLR
jgi:addiction module RelE/StbE family toxin